MISVGSECLDCIVEIRVVAEWTSDVGVGGIGVEIKLFPPPIYHGDLEKWKDSPWQLNRYVLYQKMRRS